MRRCLIHYFSGTGNTYHMVKALENELVHKGYEVDLLNIEKGKEKKLVDYDLHIFCYPVYGFGTPNIMLKYAASLKPSRECKAAIVCTSAGAEGQSLSHFKQLLNKNGFKVFLTDMVTYTYNWTQIFNPDSKEMEKEAFRKANAKIVELVKQIINDKGDFKKGNFINLMLSWITFIIFSKLGRKVLGKTFVADETCNNCGKCKTICPTKTIEMYKGKPRWNWKCESCQRCINVCPQKSIQLSIIKLSIIVILELLPIVIIIAINNYIADFSILFDVIMYSIMFIINTFLANSFICFLEKIELFRKLFHISYTKKYRRNIADGFKL